MQEVIKHKLSNEGNLEVAEILAEKVQLRLTEKAINLAQFKSPILELTHKLSRFLDEYKIDFERLGDDELLQSLCLMDLWIQALKDKNQVKLSELKKIISQFNITTIVWNNEEQKYTQLSAKIEDQNLQGKSRAKMFIPDEFDENNYWIQMDKTANEIMQNYVDEEKTKYVTEHIHELLPEMVKLKDESIYKNTNGNGFEIKILNLSFRSLTEFPLAHGGTFGCRAFCFIDSQNSVPIVCIPFDSMSFTSEVMHELAHAFSFGHGLGIVKGYAGFFGRSMNEAITENKNLNPLFYAYPRYILDKIYEKNPYLKIIANKCYLGVLPRDILTKEIFNIYGSEGLMKFELAVSTFRELDLKLNRLVGYDFHQCMEFFDPGNVYEATYSKIKDIVQKFSKASESLYNSSLDKNNVNYGTWIFRSPLERISNNLADILYILEYLPAHLLFSNQGKFVEFSIFIQSLNSFEYDGIAKNQQDLNWLTRLSDSWNRYFDVEADFYYRQHQTEPIFSIF
jgi:hypothetical protein